MQDKENQVNNLFVRCNSSRNNSRRHSWLPPDKGWVIINTDASRRAALQSTRIGYIIKDANARVLKTYGKKLRDCHILVAECEAVRCIILEVIMRGKPKVCINTDSQIVVNTLKGKISIPKEIINLVEDIRGLCCYFKDFVLEYCCRNNNRDADVIAKMA